MIMTCLVRIKFEVSAMHPKGGTEVSVRYRVLEFRKDM